jgi:hypothetical protein
MRRSIAAPTRTSVATIGVLALAAGLSIAGSSPAQAEPDDEWSTTFTVGGLLSAAGEELEVGDEASAQSLTSVGITQTAVNDIEEGTEPVWTIPSEVVPQDPDWDPNLDYEDPWYTGSVMETSALAPSYGILSSWSDNKSKPVVVRRGSSTWGYHHFTSKHNLTINVTKVVTKHPATRVDESSTSRVYRAPVLRLRCILSGCFVIDKKVVRTIVNPKLMADNRPKGVITAYCEGVSGACPDWVKQAVNAG